MRHQLAFIDIVSLPPRPGTRMRVSRRTHTYARVPACGWGSSSSPHSIFECKLVFQYARLFASLFLVLILASCGYTIVREKGIFKGEVVSVDVPVFKNQTLEPQVSQFFTEAFTKELVTSGIFDVNKEGSSNTLQGTIGSVRIIPDAFDANGLAIEKTIFVTVNLALSKKDGRFIKNWSFLDAEPYNCQDINLEDPNKKEALIRIAGRISRRFSAAILGDIDRKAL